jgi:polar amino acid transport system permease protein
MRRIVLPQAARVIIPPLGNEFNNMLKTTSLLVRAERGPELYSVFNHQAGQLRSPRSSTTSPRPSGILLLTTIWGVVQSWIERRLAKGHCRAAATAGPGIDGPA